MCIDENAETEDGLLSLKDLRNDNAISCFEFSRYLMLLNGNTQDHEEITISNVFRDGEVHNSNS